MNKQWGFVVVGLRSLIKSHVFKVTNFVQVSQNILYDCPTRFTCPAHLVILVIIQIIFGDEYQLRSSLRSFLQRIVNFPF